VDDAGAVTVAVNGVSAERLDRGWRVDLTDLQLGRQSLAVVARDEAGNESRSSEVVSVGAAPAPVKLEGQSGPLERASSSVAPKRALEAQAAAMVGASGGAVAGQVVSDLTSLPIAGATVRLVATGEEVLTDEKGTYSLGVTPGPTLLQIEKEEMTDAERSVLVATGTGVVAVDARLVPLGAVTTIGSSGGTLNAEFQRRLRPEAGSPSTLAKTTLTIEVPPGAVSGATALTLTPISAQGLPALLPLGVSPVVAFGFQGAGVVGPVNGHFAGLPATPMHLTTYDRSLHAWTLAASPLAATDGVLDLEIPGTGVWALVALDPSEPPAVLPAPGSVLPGVGFQSVPADATGATFADPPSLPASGGVSRGRLVVGTAGPLPSGTVVQAILTETFTLVSGETASGDERYEDLVLYRADVEGFETSAVAGQIALAAEVPIASSREFGPAELAEGRIRLAIQAGREGIRDVGGAGAVVVTSGDLSLSIPAGAAASDTVVSLRRADVPSPTLPTAPGVTARVEFQLDLSGATLSVPAELSLPAVLAPAGGSLFVARVEWMGDTTRLKVVALAERVGDRIVTRPHSALPGIRQGGRYVVIHAVPAVGFLAGTVRAAGQPKPALVTTAGLPFAWLAGSDGAYVVLTTAGTVRAQARVLGTTLIGTADAMVASGSVTAVDIELEQAITIATVSPADGAVAVPPTRQIEIESSAPLDPASATAENMHLRRTATGQTVAVRTVLSASGLRLAVIPQATLAYATQYTFEASGLRDAAAPGGQVAVPSVTFTTAPQATQTLDLDALRFSFPVNGEVTMSAPVGALPSGTQILVLNVSNGQIVTYTVGDLPVEATLLASIEDRLWITVTDPDGRETTFERTEYVAPDGKTAVGVAGGKVRGPDGSELRLPEGATDGAVTLKISPLKATDLAPGTGPDLPGARFGAGIKIESADKPTFKKEVDLAFPRPKDAPEGSFFYVYRKIDLPGGRVSFQTIDQAFVEGDKVVTASYPFLGYMDSFGSFGGAGGGLQAALMNYTFLMWTYDELLPARSASGVITGTVLQAEAVAGELEYTPTSGAIVTGLNQGGYSALEDPASNSVSSATTDATGTFTLIDARYTGGLVGVSVLAPDGRTKIGTAYQSNPMDSGNYNLRFFANIARLTVTFDKKDPDPKPAAVTMQVVREDANGDRHSTDGLIVEGAALRVGIRKQNADIEAVSVGTVSLGFEPDTYQTPDPPAFDVITSPAFVASPPGTYVVAVQARDTDGVLRTVSETFRVVPEGGGNDQSDVTSPPRVLELRSFPKAGAIGVPVTAVPFVVFSEPVRNLPGNVTLLERDKDGTETSRSVRLIGVQPGSALVPDLTDPLQAVVSVTIQPVPGLDYDKTYRIELRDGIVDLDEPSAASSKPLVPYSLEFKTVALPPATGQGTFASPGLVVQDGFAYLVQNELTRGTLKVFDVRKPMAPVPVPSADRYVANRPIDLAGSSHRIIVGTTATNKSLPSNLQVFDTTQPSDPRWVGAASVSNGVVDGALVRLVVRGHYAYALTQRKGVQTVDVRKAEDNFAATGGPGTVAYIKMVMALSTDGQGFGQDAVVSTIPLPVNASVSWLPFDLDVGDYPLGGRMKPVVFVAAEDFHPQPSQCSLLVGNPEAAAIVTRVNLRAWSWAEQAGEMWRCSGSPSERRSTPARALVWPWWTSRTRQRRRSLATPGSICRTSRTSSSMGSSPTSPRPSRARRSSPSRPRASPTRPGTSTGWRAGWPWARAGTSSPLEAAMAIRPWEASTPPPSIHSATCFPFAASGFCSMP
jgi:hypothetical protein